ncbi:unnamed protein product [Hymenolepis diminuta]|uniref:Uncharacterized protein n=1 Tax=Hymenolepis diminuta TaxID=6216 RepID=A0A564YT50_HYMDI|nr:unnamed protein product [Hymenolepis diminuta]
MKRPAEGGFLQVFSKGLTSAWKTNREQDAQKNLLLSNWELPLMKIQLALLGN